MCTATRHCEEAANALNITYTAPAVHHMWVVPPPSSSLEALEEKVAVANGLKHQI